ncbi:hypothetical protein [Motilimonas pumila]|uniref:Uncharacterized protein n=1 Tax=Motilimonas pumila TaxID=2303987 RepID=A0A418YGL5_9GAMM|nr:hypothetical protein [Motilimonas pumila]RJG48963.1 hypothetical protein D1Z90_07105 [Motilimonas pumila]
MIRFLFILSAALLVGCDSHNGIVRTAKVDRIIDYRCIEESLRSIQAVSNIEYAFMSGNQDMTEEMKHVFAQHRYHYTIGDINSFVSVLTNNSGSEVILFTTRNMWPPSQETVNTIRPVMDNIQVAISECCGVENFTTLVVEKCIEVQCNK